MGIACDILKPIFTNNSSTHSLSHCFDKLHMQQLKQRLTKPLRTCRRLMNVQLIGFCNMSTQNIGAELYFVGKRYGHLTSNIAESLNSWILEAREMPILAMLERIREQLMTWFSNRRQLEANTQGILVSKIATKLQTLVNTRARKYRYMQATESLYEVKSKETLHDYIVNLEDRTCSCREWQSNGYPCGHALAVILGHQEDV